MLKQKLTPIPDNNWHFERPDGLWNALAALECDTNYSPPVAVSLFLCRWRW